MKTEQTGPAAPLHELLDALRSSEADVAQDYAHCTKLERRGMTAMRRHQLYGWISGRYLAGSPEALAYSVIGHAWWIAGLVLQRDRKSEVKIAASAATWRAMLEHHQVPHELLAFAVQAGALKDEAMAEAFSSEVWQRLGLDAKTRHRA